MLRRLILILVSVMGLLACAGGTFGSSEDNMDSSSSSTVFDSLFSWKSSLETLVGYVDSFAKEDCEEFPCDDGELVRRKAYSVEPDGCGSFGYNVDSYVAPGMRDCCNQHDRCFSECPSSKTKCDKQFKTCLYDTCRKQPQSDISLKVCQISAKVLYGATTLAGCSSFHQAQKSACICQHSKTNSKHSSKSDL